MNIIMNLRRCIVYAILVIFGISCSESAGENSNSLYFFMAQNMPGLVKNKSYKILYKESAWQSVRNKQRGILRIQNGSQSEYLHLKMISNSLNNAQEEYTVNVLLTYKTSASSQEVTESLEMTVVKSEDMKVWLWSEEHRTGVIMPL